MTDKPLPRDLYDALTRIADGTGLRKPTVAHPDCRCGKPYPLPCSLCGAEAIDPCREVFYGDGSPFPASFHYRGSRIARPQDCPVHRKDRP